MVIENGKEGYILYVNDRGQWENDIFCVVLKDGGELLHCTTKQITVDKNFTYEIKNKVQ